MAQFEFRDELEKLIAKGRSEGLDPEEMADQMDEAVDDLLEEVFVGQGRAAWGAA